MRRVEFFKLKIRIPSRKQICEQTRFRLFIRGPRWVRLLKKNCQKISWHCHFKVVHDVIGTLWISSYYDTILHSAYLLWTLSTVFALNARQSINQCNFPHQCFCYTVLRSNVNFCLSSGTFFYISMCNICVVLVIYTTDDPLWNVAVLSLVLLPCLKG